MKSQFPDDESFRFVNCALCDRTLLGDRHRQYWVDLTPGQRIRQPIVCCRVDGRPYCSLCMRVKVIGPFQQVEGVTEF